MPPKKQINQVYGRTFLRELLTETIIGMIFWSVFQELIPAIALKVVKHHQTEYFVVSAVWFSPVLFILPGLPRFFQSSFGLLLLRLVMIGSLASVQAPTPEMRLILLAVGNFAAILHLVSTWWHKSCHQRSTSFWGVVLGFVGVITLKIWYVSINPVWESSTSNSVFIALGVLAALDRFSTVEYPLPEFKAHPEFANHWIIMGGGFGSLMFFTQWLFGDPSILCRWGVQGFPTTGPHPFPAGVAVFVELMSGILLSTNQKLATNFLWVWFVGGHMTIGVYYLWGFLTFACGLILAPFMMSSWTEVADRVTSCPPVPTMMLAMAVYVAEVYFSIATVIPGLPYGFLFNGRGIWIVAPGILLVGRCLLKGAFREPEKPGNTHMAFCNLDGTGCFQMFADAKIYTIIILLLGAGGYAKQHLTHSMDRPAPKNPQTFTGLVWNSQFMLDNDGMLSHNRIADFLSHADADVIALVQSDSSKLFLGNRDTSLWLSRKLGLFDDFGPASTFHTTGVSLLSKYPIVSSDHHIVNSTESHWVPVLTATLNVSSNLLDVVVAHFPQQRSTMDRRYQIEFITNFTRRSPNPVLFLSSLSCEPVSGDYRRLKTFGKLKDIDPLDEDRFIFSIMYKNLIRLGFARVSQAGLSNVEAQMAKFQFTSVKSYKDNEHVTIETSDVDKSVLFPESFGGYLEGLYSEGKDHRYQMGTPRYFISHGEGPE